MIFASQEELKVGTVFKSKRPFWVNRQLVDPQPMLVLREATKEEYVSQILQAHGEAAVEEALWQRSRDHLPSRYYDLATD